MNREGDRRITSATRRALGVAGLYGLVGAIWIGYSDAFVASLDLDIATLTRIQQYKGWGYVGVTAVLLFVGLRYLFAGMDRAHGNLTHKHERLMALNRLYRMIRAVKGALLRVHEAEVVLQEACRVAVVEGGYRLAWVALRSPDGQEVHAAAHAGLGETLFDNLRLGANEVPDSPVMRALRHGRTEMDTTTLDPALTRHGDEAAQLGYRSVVALPLRVDREVVGVFAIYADRDDSFADLHERNLLVEIADNLALALGFLHRGRALDELAHYDAVTGLANRTQFEQHLTQALVRAERRDMAVAVIIVDVDDFRSVNLAGGREAGDHVLQAVARILTATIRPGDTVARMGNDEFAVLLVDLPEAEQAGIPVGRIADALPQQLEVAGQPLYLSASLGIALYPGDGHDADELIARAELALRSQPHEQRSTISYYGFEINERVQQRRRIELALRASLGGNTFQLAWQPIRALDRDAINAVEVLLRWQHPELGAVSPATFIPVAEQTGLIVPLGEDVLRRACAQAAAWSDPRRPPLQVGVNVAVQQFRHPHFPALVESVLAEYGNAHWQLVLEITESELIRDPEPMFATCRHLRELGCAILVDDFGTGYSALSYLTQLPVDGLKIDRSFIVAAEHDSGARAIIEAVVMLARRLRLTIIAEGVETRAQLAILRELGCTRIQGFLVGRPQAGEDFRRNHLLAERQRA